MSRVDWSPQTLVADVKDLVTLPELALRIAAMVDDPRSSANDIGREISNDAGLTARLLRVANGPAFGQKGNIVSINRAIAVLGVRQVRDLAVGLTAIRSFDGIGNDLVTMESFWRHSVLCAVAAGQLAARGTAKRIESPFVCGLLHDIGQLVLFSRAPQLARQALSTAIESLDDPPLYRCEREVMGFDHGAIGGALARQWGLPKALQECIEFHHEPARAEAHPLEAAIVHIANSTAVLAEIGSTDVQDAPEVSPAALKAAGVDLEELSALAQQTREAGEEILPLLTGTSKPAQPTVRR
jgi:HD-like signal output (HDOD) protein